MGAIITRNSWMNSHKVFKLGGRVGHVTRHVWQLFKVKRSKVKVTRSRDVSADKNAVPWQWMVISTSNLVGIINVGVDACGILSRSVCQTSRLLDCGWITQLKQQIWKRRYYLSAHWLNGGVLLSNSAFFIFAVLVAWFSHSRRYKMF